jgi:hypothetical protein
MSWIAYDVQLPDKPEVAQLARALKITKAEATVACLRAWAWADEHTADGNVPGIFPEDLDGPARQPNFGKALIQVGWLQTDDQGILFPNWDRWNTCSAKERLQSTDRKRRQRRQQKD